MKSIKKFWEGLSYWVKGGVIGFIIPLLIIVFNWLFIKVFNLKIFASLVTIIAIPTFLISYGLKLIGVLDFIGIQNILNISEEYGVESSILLGIFSTPIFYLIIGMLIGIIYQKYKVHKKGVNFKFFPLLII